MGAKFSSASGEGSDAAGTPAPPPAESLLARRRAAHSMQRRADSDSQQHVLSQPDVVQRFVEYLPFDEVTKIKAVARPFRTAARRALTRGRWRPLRFLDERGEGATRESIRISGPAPLSSDEVDLLHEAWAIAPGEVLRIILDWYQPHEPSSTYLASVFLRYVEPGIRYQQDIDELRKCPRTTTCLLSFLARPDGGFARVVAAFESCNSKLIDLPLRDEARKRMVWLLCTWLTRAHHDVFQPGLPRSNIPILASPEWLGNELELWANPIEAAKFVISGPFWTIPGVTIDVPWHGTPVQWNVHTPRRLITYGWKDRRAASAFDRHLFDWTRTAEGRAHVGDPPPGPQW